MSSSLAQRSSWTSSFATGIIGWNSFVIIVALALGYSGSVFPLIAAASVAAIIQVTFLRLLFFPLRMDRGLLPGFLWGSVSGGLIILAESYFLSLFQTRLLPWLLNGVYIGFAVGGFLSYFYRDDKAIEAEHGSQPVNYGRDAHWMEPFAFGAIVYLLVFMPRHLNAGLYVCIVGAMVGVFAAGASHFSPDQWKSSIFMFALFSLVGALFGLGSALLFRQFDSFFFGVFPLGAVAGALTFFVTYLRGRVLAKRLEGKPI